MKLPNADRAVIGPRKLRDYVLSMEHPVGRFKAPFFRKLGLTALNWELLEVQLQELVLSSLAVPDERTAFGQKYLVRGTIVGPTARSAEVVSVWIVLDGEEAPRLVTVYPRKKT